MRIGSDRSMFDAANDRAQSIANLGWIALIGFTIVSLVMWALLVWVARRRAGTFEEHAPVDLKDGKAWVIIGGLVLPGVTFAILLAVSLVKMHTAAPVVHDHTAMMNGGLPHADIRITGHRWWWEIEYLTGDPSDHVESANEIHIPVGRPVTIELRSADVIHSFWVPNLHGKVDLIPGQSNLITIDARSPGVYRGQCAEYCGAQHSNMKLTVVAEEPEALATWMAKEWAPAAPPADPQAVRGKQVFEAKACAGCHTIRGTRALGHVGPDLTHIGGRERIATNMLPNDRAYLTAWVTRPHSLKPGVVMPDLAQMTGEELDALVTYLQELR